MTASAGPGGTRSGPAEPAPRLVARLVDTLAVGLPVVLVVRVAFRGHLADLAAPVVLACCLFGYEVAQHALWGRTLGKRLSGLRVVPVGDEGPLSLSRAALRAVVYALPIAVYPVPILGGFAGIVWVAGVALVLEPTERRALHDRVAGTTVISLSAELPSRMIFRYFSRIEARCRVTDFGTGRAGTCARWPSPWPPGFLTASPLGAGVGGRPYRPGCQRVNRTAPTGGCRVPGAAVLRGKPPGIFLPGLVRSGVRVAFRRAVGSGVRSSDPFPDADRLHLRGPSGLITFGSPGLSGGSAVSPIPFSANF